MAMQSEILEKNWSYENRERIQSFVNGTMSSEDQVAFRKDCPTIMMLHLCLEQQRDTAIKRKHDAASQRVEEAAKRLREPLGPDDGNRAMYSRLATALAMLIEQLHEINGKLPPKG